jgi:hypothetical protein
MAMMDGSSGDPVWQGVRRRLAQVERFLPPIPPSIPVREYGNDAEHSAARLVALAPLATLAAVVLVVAAVALGLRGQPSGAGSGKETGIVGTVVISGGPPAATRGDDRAVTIVVTDAAGQVLERSATAAAPIKVPLVSGHYQISARYGNAGCTSASVDVATGKLSTFSLVCQIR